MMRWRCAEVLSAAIVAIASVDAGAVQSGSGRNAAPAAVANAPLRTIALTVVAQGRPHRYRVEVAATPVEQARGLMQRSRMARGNGMIFPMDPPREAGFWMEGTILPLDLVFIAPDRTVRRIAADAVPFDRSVIPSDGVVAAVLELYAGEAARIGLKPGDAVRYTLDGGSDRR